MTKLELPPLAPAAVTKRGDLLGSLLAGHAACGDLFRLRLGRNDLVFVCHPELAREVLVRRKDEFVKLGGDGQATGLGAVLGNGLLTNPDAESWFVQRRIVAPLFHRERSQGWARAVAEAGERLVRRCNQATPGSAVDVVKALLETNLEIIGELVFSLPAEVARSSGLEVPLSLATARASEQRAKVAALDEKVAALVAQRRRARAAGQNFGDILDLLLEARDAETGAVMNERQLRDELLTLFAAGHETTANALTWTLYALAQHPQVQTTLHADLDIAPFPPPYLQATFKEALRLYPAIPSAPRVTLQDNELGGYRLPKGARVFVSIYTIHRHRDFWQAPDSFRPERFLTEDKNPAYFPFGLGSRFCVGRELALLTGHTLLAHLARHFHFRLPPNLAFTPAVAISLYPRGGLELLFEPR